MRLGIESLTEGGGSRETQTQNTSRTEKRIKRRCKKKKKKRKTKNKLWHKVRLSQGKGKKIAEEI